MIYDKGEYKMNKQLLLAMLAMLTGLAGCARYSNNETYCQGPDCGAEYVVAEDEVIVNEPPYICQTAPNSSLCQKDPFVNYTRTPADFRAYGERTPRDHMISQAGAGNNLSAAIPPSIDHEVIAYEEQIKVTQTAEPAVEAAVEAQGTDGANEVVVEDEVVANDGADTEIEVVEEVDEEDPVQDWLAEEGQNLKALLTQWSEESGWRLVWNTNRNYVLSAGAMFRGRFADVSSALIRAFARARPAPIATFYKGNRVLVVETMEDENAYE